MLHRCMDGQRTSAAHSIVFQSRPGTPDRSIETTIYFRIPEWSKNTMAKLIAGGKPIELDAAPGSYLPVKRIWRKSDRVKLDLDMNLYYLRSDEYVDGRTSVYRGPRRCTV